MIYNIILLIMFSFQNNVPVSDTSICIKNTCISIVIHGDKKKYSNEDGNIQLTIDIRNNSGENIFLPLEFAHGYYRTGINYSSTSSLYLIIQFQKLENNIYVDYEYPPNDIDLDELWEVSDTLVTLQHGQAAVFKESHMLFKSMQKGKYRLGIIYNYSELPECSENRSNWFYFKIN